MRNVNRIHFQVLGIVVCLLFAGCGGGGSGSTTPPPSPLAVTLSPTSLVVLQDGTPAAVNVTVGRPTGVTADISLTAAPLPSGVAVQISSPGSGTTGTVTFSAAGASAGSFNVTITATAGSSTGSATLALVNEVVAKVGAAVEAAQGINGRLNEFMSTSFQLASWADGFFQAHPSATTLLNGLNSRHIRMQVLERDIPESGTAAAPSWDFSYLDGMMQPVQSVADHSPEFQVAKAPAFMYANGSGGAFADPTYADFAAYAKNLVLYYNQGGFTDSGGTFHQPGYTVPGPVTYWGIYNEPNINDVFIDSDGTQPNGPAEYVKMYNAVVPQMQAADPNIKFVAVELADWVGEAQYYLPTFVNHVTAPVDVMATHFYASCNQKDTDQQLMTNTVNFVGELQYIRQQLASKPALATVPLWMTENNVNADYDQGGGISACNGGMFTTDQRGTSAFFAAWRPMVFSMFGKAGVQSLYHWAFAADAQYGEINSDSLAKYRSYWVDYYLQQYFPAPPGQNILTLSSTEPSGSESLEILPVKYDDGRVVVMVANHAVANNTDDNGAGAPRSVLLDLSALGAFTSATQLTIDSSTNPANQPTAAAVAPAGKMELKFNGYGVTFLELTP
jgi:hypothetical protein